MKSFLFWILGPWCISCRKFLGLRSSLPGPTKSLSSPASAPARRWSGPNPCPALPSRALLPERSFPSPGPAQAHARVPSDSHSTPASPASVQLRTLAGQARSTAPARARESLGGQQRARLPETVPSPAAHAPSRDPDPRQDPGA